MCVCVCVQQSVSGTVGPTLPGGLVVRIRRSHRRGPGSIPGQGSFSSSSLHLHFTKLPSLLPNTDAHQQHNSTILARARTPTPPGTPYRIDLFPPHALPLCNTAHSFPTLPAASLLPHTNFAPLHCRLAAYPGNKTTHPSVPIASGPSPHAARITITRPLMPLMEPQQDSISSSPALRSGTNPLASPPHQPHLPQMDHLHHMHSMHPTHPMDPVSFPE